MLYYTNAKSKAATIRKYCLRHGIKNKNGRPTESFMRRLVTKFEKYGSVSDLPRSGREDNVNDDDVEAILEATNQLKAQGVLPSTSNIANEVNRSKFCVCGIF